MVDELAEKIRSIGGRSIGTLIEFRDETRLSEVPKEDPHADKMLENLLLDHESIIRQLRKDLQSCEQFGDAGTTDFLTAVMEKHEKMAWMLRSFIELQNH